MKRRKRKKRKKRRLPRISSHSSCGRARRRQRQWLGCNAGFPCDVTPRAVFPSSVDMPEFPGILAGIMEQTVDIPVPQGGGRIAGPQGFLPGQSSTALQERISERLLEQMFDCIPSGGPQGFRPGQGSSSSSPRPTGISEDTDEGEKKCDSTSALEVGTASALELMDVGSLCLADDPGDRGAKEAVA